MTNLAVLAPDLHPQLTNQTGTAPAVGYQLFTYQAGTSIKQATYLSTFIDPSNQNLNPILTASDGSYTAFLDPTLVYKFVFAPANDTDPPASPLWSVDNIYPGLNVSNVTQQFIGAILYPQTPAELAAGVTPVVDYYPPGNPWRYGADGTGGANDIAALATSSTILATTGVNGWRNGAPIGGFLRTAAEISAGVLPTNYSYSTLPYDIRRYGAKIDGATDDTAAWNAALLVASQNVNGAPGSSVSMPAGVSMVSSMLFLPNRVRVLGASGMSSWVRATPGWTVGNGVTPWSGATNYTTGNLVTSGGNLYIATQANVNQSPPNATFWTPISNAMFYAQNGYVSGIGVSMFYSTLENLTVDANLVTGLGCVLSSSWQEGCGLRNCLLYQFATYGVRFQDGFGGASLSKVSDCNIFPGSASAIGIDLSTPIGAAAAFMLDVSNTSVAGPPTLTAGISCKGNSLCARNVHFENCTSAVLADGLGYISIDDMSGASSNTSLVQLASTFNGDLILKNARRNGVSNFLNDLRAGGYGAIVSDHPLLIINANDPTSVAKGGAFASAWCVFNGFTAGTNAPLAGYNVSSVTRNSTGNYTVSMLRPMLSANGAAFAMSNLATGQHSTVLSSATTFTVVIEVGGVATDSAEVKALVFGA